MQSPNCQPLGPFIALVHLTELGDQPHSPTGPYYSKGLQHRPLLDYSLGPIYLSEWGFRRSAP